MLKATSLVGILVVVGLAAAHGRADGASARLSVQVPERAIAYLGVVRNRRNLDRLGVGEAGYWFPQFAAPGPVGGRPTAENALSALPAWVAPLNHVAEPTGLGCTPAEVAQGCLPTYAFRSFSQDGPARSAGGYRGWSRLRLPGGDRGRSGAIVDPHTAGGNANNTINRIQLRGEVPAAFHLSVVTDNTAREHDPEGALRLRGNAGPLDTDQTQVEPGSEPGSAELLFNRSPDVHTFRVEGFRAGDYLKLRLAGGSSSTTGASFGGLLFDEPDDQGDWPDH